MERLKQCGSWGDVKIGESNVSVCKAGCLITSLVMLNSKFHPHSTLDPAIAAKSWHFVTVPGRGIQPQYLDWKTDFKEFEFVWRNWDYYPNKIISDPFDRTKSSSHKDIIRKACDSQDYGVAMQVQTKNGVHWLAAWKYGIFGQPICHDPINGNILYRPTGMLSKYPKFIGFAIIKRK